MEGIKHIYISLVQVRFYDILWEVMTARVRPASASGLFQIEDGLLSTGWCNLKYFYKIL